jgi:hypothetical protein
MGWNEMGCDVVCMCFIQVEYAAWCCAVLFCDCVNIECVRYTIHGTMHAIDVS